MRLVDEMAQLMTKAADEAAKVDMGQKAAIVRLRKVMQEIKKKADAVRSEALRIRNDGMTPRVADQVDGVVNDEVEEGEEELPEPSEE